MKIVKRLYVLPFLLFIGLMFPLSPAFSAEAESKGEWVEVPPALGPEAMTSLVSKLDQGQTEALVSLMELLNTSAATEPDETMAGQAQMTDTLQLWLSSFGETMALHLANIPNMFSGMAEAITDVFSGRGLGGSG